MFWSIDEALFRALFGDGHPGPMRSWAIACSALGSGWSLVPLAALLVYGRTRRFAAAALRAIVLTAIVVYVAKLLVGRDRPALLVTDLARAIVDAPSDHSFPSGHAAGSFTFATFTLRVALDRSPRPRWLLPLGVACVVLAGCVGVSRVVVGAHFPGDVLGGTLLGSAVGAAAARRFATRARAPL